MRVNIFLIFYSWYISKKIATFAQDFPSEFLFSASTAAFQVEGAWNVDGEHIYIFILNEESN